MEEADATLYAEQRPAGDISQVSKSSQVCLFALIVYLISVRFKFHLYFNSKIFVFVLSLIFIFNLSITRFKIYLFIYIITCCMFFAMIVYLISVRFGFHLFFKSNFWSF